MAFEHYRLDIVGQALVSAREGKRWSIVSCGNSNETANGGTGVIHGSRVAIPLAAFNNGINHWCTGPMNGPGVYGQTWTPFFNPLLSAGSLSDLATGFLSDYLRSANTNAGNIYIPNGTSVTNFVRAGADGYRVDASPTDPERPADYDPENHAIDWLYRYYTFATNDGDESLQLRIRESGGGGDNDAATGSVHDLHTPMIDGVEFASMSVGVGGILRDAIDRQTKYFTQAVTGLAVWSDWYERFADVPTGLHLSPLWNLSGGKMTQCEAELVVTTPANDIFLKRRFVETALVQNGGTADPNVILRIALGGNDWSGTQLQQGIDRPLVIAALNSLIDHVEAVWVDLGYSLDNLVFLIEAYHASDFSGTDNPLEYGFRSDLRAVAVSRDRCSFLNPALIKTASEMDTEGLYEGGVGVTWHPHRSDPGYDLIHTIGFAEMMSSRPSSVAGGAARTRSRSRSRATSPSDFR